ncbi:MAG: hypothetical protein ACUZ8O_13260 [Candidatus Anammoxibacter sp.]
MTKAENKDDLGDWRLQAVSTLAKPFKSPYTGKEYPVGTKVNLTTVAQYDKKRTLSIPTPNATAMFLNIAYKFNVMAKNMITIKDNIELNNKALSFCREEDAIDYVEYLCASVVFAYNALEAFANEEIPEKIIFRQKRRDNKFVEEYTKEQIERNLSTDVKFDKVLPEIFGIKSPKGKKIWQEYAKLKRVRDRIIHLKSADRRSSEPADKTIWNLLLHTSLPNMAVVAKQLIDYFACRLEKPPRWHQEYPYKMH